MTTVSLVLLLACLATAVQSSTCEGQAACSASQGPATGDIHDESVSLLQIAARLAGQSEEVQPGETKKKARQAEELLEEARDAQASLSQVQPGTATGEIDPEELFKHLEEFAEALKGAGVSGVKAEELLKKARLAQASLSQVQATPMRNADGPGNARIPASSYGYSSSSSYSSPSSRSYSSPSPPPPRREEAPAPAPPPACNEQLTGTKGSGYRGCRTTTRTGRTCQKWTLQSPHRHSRTPQNYPNKGLGDHNYCRNPDGGSTIWCYTRSPSKRWEYCQG